MRLGTSKKPKPSPELSILVPFRDDGEERQKAWSWLKRFWEYALPDAEIVVGVDHKYPFSKAVAVNEAAARARGAVFAVMDADCYMDPRVIQGCTESILFALAHGRRNWFVPYIRLYRLNQKATASVLHSDPRLPFDFPTPPPPQDIDNHGSEGYGHQFGALILVMPRDAFFAVGGLEPRMRGWGAEDGAFMKSLDTLWGLHETTDNETLHLWHRRPGNNFMTREWVGQRGHNVNARLGQRYNQASGDSTLMRALIAERVGVR